MSFILDALKKLEQKQRHGSVPDLMTVHPDLPAEKENRHIWTYLILAALLLNAVILTVWLRPWKAEQQPPALHVHEEQKKSVAGKENQEAAVPSATLNNTENTDRQSDSMVNDLHNAGPDNVSAKNTSDNPDKTSMHDKSKERPVENDTSVTSRLDLSTRELEELRTKIKQEKSSLPSASSVHTESSDISGNHVEREILEYGKLPQSVRDELPEIKIIAHIYSNDPGSRIANINGSIIKEGETVTAGLRVEEITLDGIVFDFNGFRFRMRAF